MDRDDLLQARNRERTDFPWVDLRGQDLRSLDLRQCNLRQAKLENTNLSQADLADASLIKAEANRANFSQAILTEVRGTGAFFNGANFEAAILTGANLHKAQLEQAQLSRAQMENIHLEKGDLTRADCAQSLATDANLREAQLQGGIWSKAQLTGADLAGADLTNCNFQGADLRSADLRETQLDNTDFSETDLRGAKLSWGTNPLDNARFTGAIMPDGVAFDGDWQPPQIQAKPVPYLRPAPPPPQTRDRPNRFLLINPFFQVPDVGPKDPPPPPKTVTEWRKRLPWIGLLGLLCAYAGWGAILIKLNTPLTAIALLLLSALLPAVDLATLPYMPLMGYIAALLAFPNPIFQALTLAVALVTGLALGISGKISIGWSSWRSLQATLWITETVVAVMLLFLWTFGGGSVSFVSLPLTLLALFGTGLVALCAPSWIILQEQGLSSLQRSLVSLMVTAGGLLLGNIFWM